MQKHVFSWIIQLRNYEFSCNSLRHYLGKAYKTIKGGRGDIQSITVMGLALPEYHHWLFILSLIPEIILNLSLINDYKWNSIIDIAFISDLCSCPIVSNRLNLLPEKDNFSWSNHGGWYTLKPRFNSYHFHKTQHVRLLVRQHNTNICC